MHKYSLLYQQQLYDKRQMFHKVFQADDATRQAAIYHRCAWAEVMLQLNHLLVKGYSFPSQIKQGNTGARTDTCAKKLTKKGVVYKNWASRMKPYKRLYHVTVDNLREGTYSHKIENPVVATCPLRRRRSNRNGRLS
jgi:hypothetical protein